MHTVSLARAAFTPIHRIILAKMFVAAGVVAALSSALAAPGDLYETNYDGHSVFKFTPDGTSTTYTTGFAANGIAFDANKNLFVTDWDAGIIYKFTPDGTRSTFATNLSEPYALAFDSAGNLFETDFGSSSVNKFTPSGTKSRFASGVQFAGGLVFGADGYLYVGGFGSLSGPNRTIYRIAPDGTKTIFSTGVTSTGGLVFDQTGNLFVADYRSSLLFKINSAGQATQFSNAVNHPEGIVIDPAGNFLVADYGSGRILKFTPDGNFTVFASKLNGVTLLAFEPAPPPPLPKLLNISTRMRVLTGDKVLIGGFIVTGPDSKKVIIRGVGPSLANIQGAMADPSLELRQGDTIVATNDNWREHQAEVQATTIAPTNDLEAAIVATLSPGSYTAILAGHNGGSGVGILEVYDLNQAANSTLSNISSRGFVDTGDNAMIGGLIVGGGSGDSNRVIFRAIGPSLAAQGVSEVLADPTLELHDSNGATIDANDNWKSDHQTEIQATGIAPTDDKESAIVRTLSPGAYTAIVRGVNSSVGVGLVEAYHLN